MSNMYANYCTTSMELLGMKNKWEGRCFRLYTVEPKSRTFGGSSTPVSRNPNNFGNALEPFICSVLLSIVEVTAISTVHGNLALRHLVKLIEGISSERGIEFFRLPGASISTAPVFWLHVTISVSSGTK